MSIPAVITRYFGQVPYTTTWQAMREFTDTRSNETPDELWVLQHPPVFTLGQAGRREHILQTTDIPIIETDRGGQVTYHGPGQIVIYALLDLSRSKLGVRTVVSVLEGAVIELLADLSISANSNPKAPGVYVDEKKIASVGLRIRRGRSYHGLAFNVNMDLSPFSMINPCGIEHLEVTQLSQLKQHVEISKVANALLAKLHHHLQNSDTPAKPLPLITPGHKDA